MYSWPIGNCFSKPASMRNWTANQPITTVSAKSAHSTAARRRNSVVSRRCKARTSIEGSAPGRDASPGVGAMGPALKLDSDERARRRSAGLKAAPADRRVARRCASDQKLRETTTPKKSRSLKG
jgi:hypothetical protein